MTQLVRFLFPVLLGAGGVAINFSNAEIPPFLAASAPSTEHLFGWRGNGTGHYPSATPVTHWSTNQNILWKTDVGLGQSSPIVVASRVLLTVEPDLLLCLDADSGKELWRKAHPLSELPDSMKPKEPPSSQYGDVTPTPVSDGKRVWVFLGTGIVACYGLDGTRHWLSGFDLPLTTMYGRTASPVLVGERLLVHFGPLVCLDAATGKLLWKNDEAKANYGTPAPVQIGGVDVLITPKGDAVRIGDGKLLASDLGNSMYASPVVHSNVVYFIDSDISAVRLPSQAAEQIQCKTLWSGELSGEFYASPLVHGGLIYAVDNTANFYVFDAGTGKTLLKKSLEFPRSDRLNVYPSPCLTGKHLFVGSDTGDMLVLEPGQEGAVLGSNSLPRGSGATPAFSGRRMFIRGGKMLYCIGAP